MLAGVASADGEKTPMIGGAFLGGESAHSATGEIGVELEAAWWLGRVGFALEGSVRETAGGAGKVVGASARVRILEGLLPSLLEPRDVELGLELQAIAERSWWDDSDQTFDPVSYGLGIALRLRGGGDEESSNLLAESRFFIRVMSPASSTRVGNVLARMTGPIEIQQSQPEAVVLVGIGASWGSGERSYVRRFQTRPFEWDYLRKH
jgi:hypothetical protein